MWVLTVASLTKRSLAISALLRPRASSRRVSRSRAVSDASNSDLPLDFNRVFSERGDVSFSKVVGQLVRSPGRLPGLLRLANESERASAALAQFLDAYLEQMEAGPWDELAKAEALAI